MDQQDQGQQGQQQGQGQGTPIPPVPVTAPMPQAPMPQAPMPQAPMPQAPMPQAPMPQAPMPQAAQAPAGAYYPPAAPMGGGAYYPPAAPMGGGAVPMPGGYQPPMGGGAVPVPVPEPEDTTPANFQLATKLPGQISVPVPKHQLNFDENYFIRLLAGSISLSKDEKKKIIESIPKLKQTQIDELVRIFEEERQKFAALSKKHVPQLEKLAEQHYQEWMDLEADYKHSAQKEEDTSKADEIRKNLGL